jgi:DNA-directed RNA polymerase alpha subunit
MADEILCPHCGGKIAVALSVSAVAPEDLPIDHLCLASHAYHRLKAHHIDTIGQLTGHHKAELLRLKNISRGVLNNIEWALSLRGLKLREE